MYDPLKRHEDMKAARRHEEATWRKIAYFLRPDSIDFDSNAVRQQRDDTELYDSTALYANNSFAKGLFRQAANPANRWFELTTEDRDLAAFRPVREWRYAATNIMYASLAPQRSRFYTQCMPWFADLGAFGWGGLYQEENVGRGRITDRALPIAQLFLDVNAEGEIDTVHREFKLNGRRLKEKFARHPAQCHDDADYTIVHCVYPNPELREGALGPAGMAFRSTYVSADLKDWRIDGGYHELPYHIPTWNERPGRAYPTGPGFDARGDMQALNEHERASVIAANYAAEPPILLHEESGITAADIVPGAVLYGAMNLQGKRLLEQLERRQNVQLNELKSEQIRGRIRQAFHWQIMQLINRPQMTATEFAGFEQANLEEMAPHLVMVQTGGLTPFLTRRFNILWRAGAFPPPPLELADRALEIEYVSPLAKAQKIGEARAALQFVTSLATVATLDTAAGDNLDGDAAARVLHEGLYFGPPIMRDPREVQQIRAGRAQAEQQAAQLEQAAVVSEISATQSHARQAETLARARVTRQ